MTLIDHSAVRAARKSINAAARARAAVKLRDRQMAADTKILAYFAAAPPGIPGYRTVARAIGVGQVLTSARLAVLRAEGKIEVTDRRLLPVEPCGRCGTRRGRIVKECVRPSRLDATPYGGPPCVCASCYGTCYAACKRGLVAGPLRVRAKPAADQFPACDLCGQPSDSLAPGRPHQLDGLICPGCIEEVEAEVERKVADEQLRADAVARAEKAREQREAYEAEIERRKAAEREAGMARRAAMHRAGDLDFDLCQRRPARIALARSAWPSAREEY